MTSDKTDTCLWQIALGTCTWSTNYHTRPRALTPTILCFSITCNITAGILISIGDRLTRKKDVIERMFRQNLTEKAIATVESRKKKAEAEDEETAVKESSSPEFKQAEQARFESKVQFES